MVDEEYFQMEGNCELSALDVKLLMGDPEGRMLLETMGKHKKQGFLDKVRKEHEHEMREHKEFLATIAKVKNITTSSLA